MSSGAKIRLYACEEAVLGTTPQTRSGTRFAVSVMVYLKTSQLKKAVK